MRSNGLLKWLVIPVVLLAVCVGIRLFSGNDREFTPRSQGAGALTPDEMKALGIEGDTPADTVATLVAQVKQLRGELHTAMADNEAQRAENARLRQRENTLDQRISAALNSERAKLQRDQERLASDRQQAENVLEDIQRRLDHLGNPDGPADLPVGLGLREGDGTGMTGAGDGIRWVEPDDVRPDDARNGGNDGNGSGAGAKPGFPARFGPAQRTRDDPAHALAEPGPRIERRPGTTSDSARTRAVYTVPVNSTLMGSVAMTALIGRVPVDGTVNDPYPFKVLVGPDNLTANGIDIPDVAGAVFSGTASGDWTLSCVRGQLRSITFVFHDGTVRTIPEDRSGNQQHNTPQNALGWISDPYGIPCVSGERRSNARQYLGTQALITAAGAGAASLITSDSGRLTGGLANAGIQAQRLDAARIHDWLLRWFNPNPTLIGQGAENRERFYALTAYPEESEAGEIELASGRDFSQRLFFSQPRSDVNQGVWVFDGLPHRVMVADRLRSPPATGHLTGETKKGDAINTLFDQMPEDTVMCLTLVITPQDVLEAHLNRLARKAIGETLASEQTRRDVQEARSLIGSSHKLYRGALAFFLRGRDENALNQRGLQLANVMLNAGLQPVREDDEVAPLNSYLRWLPGVYHPARDRRQWYTQLMFAQHAANLSPVWGRSQGTGHPGITFFNRGGGTLTFDPFNRLDRQMNAHLFLFGPTGSGKSATLNIILNQVAAIYRPRMFVVEAGNSFGLFADFARQLGMTVNRVRLAPGSGVSLAPFADARRLIETPGDVQTLDADRLDEEHSAPLEASEADEQRDVLGELEITARLMITGGEDKEDARMTRADRSLIRQCILDAARHCVAEQRTVLTRDVRDALRERGRDTVLPEIRRARLLEMADAMDMFCQGTDGEMFDRPGTPWPEADITLVDLATYAREGYNAQLSMAYISLISTVNNIAERDQFLGRPILNVTDEGHIITRNPLLSPYVVKITKMWRKLGAWFWLATQNVDDLPKAAEPMLNMIEWWICLSMPPDEVEKIARFRELSPAQKALMRSARKEAGKFTEGVILSRSMEVLFRAVPPSLYLALAQTEPEEKAERFELMRQHKVSELEAAFKLAERIDRARGITPLPYDDVFA